MRKLGIDVDGVLADFNRYFIETIIEHTGEDKFPPRPFPIPTWNYPQHYGYTHEQVTSVWNEIKDDRTFWLSLPYYPDTLEFLSSLDMARCDGDYVYFITNRPGVEAHGQTAAWLEQCGYYDPTVLISGEKGLCARALELDLYIDDKWENCLDVRRSRHECQTFLLSQPWNAEKDAEACEIRRITSVMEFPALAYGC